MSFPFISRGALAAGAILFAHAAAVAQVVPGQIDTFQDGTVDNWVAGAQATAPTVNVSSGGPAGAGDAYLKMTSLGGFGASSKMIAFNISQWTGVYTGVTSISMDLNALGSTDLNVRMAFRDSSGDQYSIISAMPVPAAGGWLHAIFHLGDSDVVQLTGTTRPFSAALAAGITEARILHSSGPAFNGDTIAATLGVDNVRALGAVPEPGTLALAGAAAACLLLRRQHERRHSRFNADAHL